jgi:hypothetical protein
MQSLTTKKEEMDYHLPPLRNPGDIHFDIDIGSHNATDDSETSVNPPLEILSTRMEAKGSKMILHYRITTLMDSVKDVEKILKTLYPGWRAISHGSLKAGTYPNVKHAYGVTMVKTYGAKNPPIDHETEFLHNRIVNMLLGVPNVENAEAGRMGTGAYFYEVEWADGQITRNERFRTAADLLMGAREFIRSWSTKGGRRHNPPLPASALIDISTAKTTAREVEDGQRPLGNLGTVDFLLDRGLQKLRGSHLGNVDWQNPGPGRVQYYKKREGGKSSEWVGRAMELQEEVVDLLTRFHARGIVSLEELNLARRVLFLLKDIPLALRAERDNPPGKEIYRDIVEIKAIKADGKRYVHKFGKGSHILGLPDGSILIESRKGKRLWKNFKAGG